MDKRVIASTILLLFSIVFVLVIVNTFNTSDSEETTPKPTDSVPTEGCQTDKDCVPAECCHPKTCTLTTNAPDCTKQMCTMDCAPGTMDCGQGSCVCENKQCKASFS